MSRRAWCDDSMMFHGMRIFHRMLVWMSHVSMTSRNQHNLQTIKAGCNQFGITLFLNTLSLSHTLPQRVSLRKSICETPQRVSLRTSDAQKVSLGKNICSWGRMCFTFWKNPPPSGEFPIYYVPWSRTRIKRISPGEPGENNFVGGSSEGILFLWVLDLKTTQQRNPPGEGGVFRSTLPHSLRKSVCETPQRVSLRTSVAQRVFLRKSVCEEECVWGRVCVRKSVCHTSPFKNECLNL